MEDAHTIQHQWKHIACKLIFSFKVLNSKLRCDSNHYGLRCELKRPCANHDCKGGMCIELPFSPESEYKFPACVCKSSQTINSSNNFEILKNNTFTF